MQRYNDGGNALLMHLIPMFKKQRFYPTASHTQISHFLAANDRPNHNRYACYVDYSDDYAAHLGNIP